MKPTVKEIVRGVEGLVTLPHVFVRINQLVDSPDSSVDDIVKAVTLDPSFTVRLLGLANSSYYGFFTSVDTVAKAVSIIGSRQIRNLALSTQIANSFAGLPNSLVSMDNFWRHSLYCALAARKLAGLAGKFDRDALFTAALLHDIGELVIFNRLPDEAKAALLLVLDSGDELAVHQAEQQTMGLDHAQVGANLAQQWNLPAMLVECIAFHHDIHAATKYPREVALVHIANILAQMAEVDSFDPADVATIDHQAWKITGLAAADIVDETIREIQSEITEAEKFFLDKH
ncbi:MAG: HDOD domain-containing protein [Gallionellaceae bacterium]|jgi:putative nucleotidyltransferase with HDIG domain